MHEVITVFTPAAESICLHEMIIDQHYHQLIMRFTSHEGYDYNLTVGA